MTAYEELWEAQRVIGKHWRKDQPPEETRVLGLARDALDFISATGQRHRFRDYRQSQSSATPQTPEGVLGPVEHFFRNLLDTPQPPEVLELIRVVVDALHFIATTGQLASLEEYVKHLEAGVPPYVVASFSAIEEAEAWLMSHADPPDFAHIIVGSEYRSVSYDRQTNIRKLPNDNAIEYYLAELQQEEPPVPQESFAALDEAEAWLRAQPEPPKRVLSRGE